MAHIEEYGKAKRLNFSKNREIVEIPNFTQMQLNSYEWFLKEGFKEVLDEVFPIYDFAGNYELSYSDYTIENSKYSVAECKEKDVNYEGSIKLKTKLIDKESGEIKEADIYVGELPLMTDNGTFIINGIERVIVSQLIKSSGLYFSDRIDFYGNSLYSATIIPNRGAWFELEMDTSGVIYARIDKTKKLPVTTFLKSLGYTNEAIIKIYNNHENIQKTLAKDNVANKEGALMEIYHRLRTGETGTIEAAEKLLNSLFFDVRRYDLAKVGRYKINKKLNLSIDENIRHLTKEDIINTIGYLLKLIDGEGKTDVIDHLGNRRIRSSGELIQNQFRVGLTRMERIVKERMNMHGTENLTPQALINFRPINAAIKEFFGSSQLSQFMDQVNPLAELTHKRRLSALGPGGLTRERAGFQVRDVHHSHYGRICPIETPEGPNIGLIGSLATYGRVDDFGFIKTPYRKVDKKTGQALNEIIYLSADEEDEYIIAQANTLLDEEGYFIDEKVEARWFEEIVEVPVKEVDFIDVSPKQVFSVATSLIPFLENDDANRALMGANMQRQAVPLIKPQSPIVGTGLEHKAAKNSGAVIISKNKGIVKKVDANEIVIENNAGILDTYNISKYTRSNQGTCYNQRPIVKVGDYVEADEIIADGASTERGELALGRNVLVAFMPWEGYNYEDAILISEKLIKDDAFTSIHIEKYECETRDTKLGLEEITREVPNIPKEMQSNLDEFGVIRIGAKVKPDDILVGKVTPKGEVVLDAEMKLVHAILGEIAHEVRDTSLRVPHGGGGTIIGIKKFSRKNGDILPIGTEELVRVYVAQKRKLSVGDKMAGRHGNKGVISRILPEEDMPFLEDGTPVEIVLNPLGVPSRMNIGQILECHLGWAASKLGYKIATPVFDGANENDIFKKLKEAGLPENGKAILHDGRTGEPFDNKVTVGYVYMLKLAHLVDDKIHARSIGPYSLVTQQPLGGKAQFGGQRMGEMEVWALEAYGASHILQEFLTIKSDDMTGRLKAYEAIVKGQNIPYPTVPEGFKVLIKELQSLGLNISLYNKEGDEIILKQNTKYNEKEKASELDIKLPEPMEELEQDNDDEEDFEAI